MGDKCVMCNGGAAGLYVEMGRHSGAGLGERGKGMGWRKRFGPRGLREIEKDF